MYFTCLTPFKIKKDTKTKKLKNHIFLRFYNDWC